MAILEDKLGVKLPPAFHEFCFRWNGGFTSKENECYHVPASCTEYYKKMWFGRKTEGDWVIVDRLLAATEEFKQCNLMKDYRLLSESEYYGRLKYVFIPIARNIMGGMAVLRSDCPLEAVYWVDPDTGEMPDGVEWGTTPGNPEARPALMPIAPNLETFYNALTADPDRD